MRRLIPLALLLALAGCGSIPPPPPAPASSLPTFIASPSIPGQPTPLPSQVSDPGHVTGTLTGPCHTSDNGSLPDRSCTPGAYDPTITAAMLCSPLYTTSSYRPPSSETTRFKYQVAEPAYGQHNVSGELDHLISLELGGSNDASNLWVEAGKIPNPKDKIENALHAWVCAASGQEAQLRLNSAQTAIALNWETAEAVLGI